GAVVAARGIQGPLRGEERKTRLGDAGALVGVGGGGGARREALEAAVGRRRGAEGGVAEVDDRDVGLEIWQDARGRGGEDGVDLGAPHALREDAAESLDEQGLVLPEVLLPAQQARRGVERLQRQRRDRRGAEIDDL